MTNCSPGEGLTLEKFVLDCPCGRDLMLELVKSGTYPLPEEEQAGTRCVEFTTAPIPIPCIAVRERVENFGVKFRLGKKGRVQGKVLLN